MVSGIGPGGKLRHGLAFAKEIHRRVNINGEKMVAVARSLGLRDKQVMGVARLTRELRRIPSPERLACIVMLDTGLDDEDVAEMFGRSVRWSSLVRSQSLAIRSEEFIPSHLEWLEPDFQPADPTVDEIYRRAAELRGKSRQVVGHSRKQWRLPEFLWDGRNASFVSVGA